jgi:hypothetical protein
MNRLIGTVFCWLYVAAACSLTAEAQESTPISMTP